MRQTSNSEIADELLMRIASAETEDFDRDKGWIKDALDLKDAECVEQAKNHIFDNYPKQMYKIDERMREECKTLRQQLTLAVEALNYYAYEASSDGDCGARAKEALKSPRGKS